MIFMHYHYMYVNIFPIILQYGLSWKQKLCAELLRFFYVKIENYNAKTEPALC